MGKTEISELYAQIEILQSEKVSIKKVVEKLEITVNEYHIKIEDLNRTCADMTSAKQRLQMEATESTKKFNEMKLAIEHAGMDKNKFAAQLDELRRAADNEARNRNAAETKITSLERNIKTLMVEIEELRSIKINLEGSIEKWKQENGDWKKKYESEARLRVEEVDAMKKKFTLEVSSLTDNCHKLEQMLKGAENAKTKLSSEVNVLIKDFEHSQVVIKDITSKFQICEKNCTDLSAKLKEMTNLYERADKDNKARAADIVKLGNEMDRLKMGNETLTRDKGVLNDECKALKMDLDALKKRMADMDRDNRKLAHEREELARAYKDADAGKQKALDRVALLEKELAKMKAEFEKKFGGAREEFEVSLDGSNKSNSQLQNTCKVQAQKIMELPAAYDDVNKKLAGSLQQYDITIKRLTQIEAEFKSVTLNYNNTIK